MGEEEANKWTDMAADREKWEWIEEEADKWTKMAADGEKWEWIEEEADKWREMAADREKWVLTARGGVAVQAPLLYKGSYKEKHM